MRSYAGVHCLQAGAAAAPMLSAYPTLTARYQLTRSLQQAIDLREAYSEQSASAKLTASYQLIRRLQQAIRLREAYSELSAYAKLTASYRLMRTLQQAIGLSDAYSKQSAHATLFAGGRAGREKVRGGCESLLARSLVPAHPH